MGTRVDIEHVVQQLMQEHNGDYRRAFYDLAGRFVAVVHGVSSGYMRWPADIPAEPIDHDLPNPVCDTWIKTGREA